MSKRKKKSSPAENLIESLMDDLKGIQSEASYHAPLTTQDEENYDGIPGLDSGENRLERTNPAAANIWDNLEKGLSGEIEASEFNGDDSSDLPDGWGDELPSAEEDRYDGPSLEDAGYQSADDLEAPPPPPVVKSSRSSRAAQEDDDHTRPVIAMSSPAGGEDKTVSIQQDVNVLATHNGPVTKSAGDGDKTVAVEGFANARLGRRKPLDVDVKVSVGSFRGAQRPGTANVFTSVDASLAQAENLRIAQQRILELEKENELLRAENEELASAGEVVRNRTEELAARITAVEKEKAEMRESAHSELLILKGNLQYKENEAAKARLKVEELESRLKSDFKKIRVRERELENRLELLRAEKAAIVRSKDEYILEQKRKVDQLSQELDNYRKKCLELNKALDANQEQFKRTERALRLALTNLEPKEENIVPLKKAE